jgi:hypothetical protein
VLAPTFFSFVKFPHHHTRQNLGKVAKIFGDDRFEPERKKLGHY